MFTERQRFYGGEYIPEAFKPANLLETIKKIVDTSCDSFVNPFTGVSLPGPRRHFINDSREKQLLTSATLPILKSVGLMAIKPEFTVIVYPPRGILAPHIDSNSPLDGSKSALLTVTGSGAYDTFEHSIEIIDQIDQGQYPAEIKHSQTVQPGDIVVSHGEVIHGYRNNAESRVALGVLGVFTDS